MSKRNAYPINLLLKMKSINPNIEFEGEDKRVYEEFLEKQAEESLLNTIDEVEKPKKKIKKVKQVLTPTQTESLDYLDEANKTTNEEI